VTTMAATDDVAASPVVAHELTVCIVVRDADAPVERALDALGDQASLPGSFDVVIVDATSDGLRLKARGRPPATVVRADPHGTRAELHDTAWRAATAAGVVFLAPDLVPAHMWTEGMIRALRRGRRVVTGSWQPNPDSLHLAGQASYRLWFSPREARLVTADQLGVLRADLERVGGFVDDLDEQRADVELAARLVDAGVDPVWARHAVVYTDVAEQTVADMMAASEHAASSVTVLDEHPRARARLLLGGVLWHRRQVEVLLALAGIAGALRSRRALLLAAPWVHDRTCMAPATGGRRRKWFVLPGVFAADVCHLMTTTRSRLAPRRRKP
jgi:hypothetical protein